MATVASFSSSKLVAKVDPIAKHLLPCERKIAECLARSASKSGEASEKDFYEAVRCVRRIAYDEKGLYAPDIADIALGHILGVIAVCASRSPGLWQGVFDATVRLSNEWLEYDAGSVAATESKNNEMEASV